MSRIVTNPSPVPALKSSRWFGPGLIAILATVLVCLRLDPGGDYPRRLSGPGLTLDEIFNAQMGVDFADPLLAGDVPKLIRATRVLPDHPPLGRLWLGLAHEMALLAYPPRGDHGPVVIACARFGSAIAFGLVVFLVGSVSTQWHGRLAGIGTSLAVVLMPRVFGHAHLAALETPLNLTYAAGFLSVACWWKPDLTKRTWAASGPGCRVAVLSGLVFGLTLLTKIQAVFLPLPVLLWALWNWRWRAFWPLAVWGLTGLLIFFMGWPWLWLDPMGHFLQYFGTASKRPVIYVWYLGQQFPDRDVPWHYPWVLFATTIPIGLQLLGLWGLWQNRVVSKELTVSSRARSQPGDWLSKRETLILAGILLPLFVFSLPGVAVYDGERLFLMVYPLWAMFVGLGFRAASEWIAHRTDRFLARAMIVGFLLLQAIGLVQLTPCWLSYYNALVGGLRGAERLGFQVTYWGDSVTRELLQDIIQHVPEDSTIDFLPVQHPFQLQTMVGQSPLLRSRNISLRAFDEQNENPARFLLVFHRRDYWPHHWSTAPEGYKLRSSTRRQNTVLAGLYERQ